MASKCSIDSLAESIQIIRATGLADATAITAKYLEQTVLKKVTAGKMTLTQQRNYEYAVEALGLTAEELAKAARKPAAKGMTETFKGGGGFDTVVKPGTEVGQREAQNYAISQHTLAGSQARIVGQARKMTERTETNLKGILPSDPMTADSIAAAAARMGVANGVLRSAGLPLVTSKAASQAGPTHVSFLTFGDILGVMLRPNTRGIEVLTNSVFRNNSRFTNVPFQNVAESVRRIIEHNDMGKTLAGEDIAALREAVVDGLTNAVGKPFDKQLAADLKETTKWLKSEEGQKAVNELADTLISPATVSDLYAENKKLMQVSAVLSRGDGISMTNQVLQTIADSPWTGQRLSNYADLIFGEGLSKLYANDAWVKLNPDKMNLAFAEQNLALAFSNISEESMAILKEGHMMTRAAAQASKTASKAPINKAKVDQQDVQAPYVEKMAREELETNPAVRAGEQSLDGARLSNRFYNEMQAGYVFNGLAKMVSKVSDVATMGGRSKTILVGTEHRILENAAIITAGLRKVADSIGQDHQRANKVFEHLKSTLDETAESRTKAIQALDAADQSLAETMIEYIDAIFGVSQQHTKMLENGIFVSEAIKSLRTVGLGKQADILAGIATGGGDVADIGAYWKFIDLAEGDKVLDIMSKYYASTQLAMMKPSIAASLIRNFGHASEGLTPAQAKAQGWQQIAADTELGTFLRVGDTPTYFPPDMIPKLQQMNYYLDYQRGFNSEIVQKVWNKMDPIISALKSSVTIWRPGHHMTSLMGNTFMNALAGVSHYDYAMAIKLMRNSGQVDEVNIPALDELMRRNIEPGYQFKAGAEENIPITLINPKTGKAYTQMLDLASVNKGADNIAGVRISARRAKDVVNEADPSAFGVATNAITNSAGFRGITTIDHQLARAGAARDNVARYALFLKELRTGGPYKSAEDAFLSAAQKVHEFHPTVGTLTAEERKYARRGFYFYTWQKQAFFKIMEMAVNQPAALTIPSKVQFAIATAAGLDPASFGDPYKEGGLFAAYNSNSTYGPQMTSEQFNALFGTDWQGAIGIKPAQPQLDVIDSYLGQFTIKPEDGLWGNVGNLMAGGATGIFAQNASPLFKIPAELATRQRIGGFGGQITDVPQYLIDQTGFSALSKVFDWTPWGKRSDTDYTQYGETNRERQTWNYLLGAKITFYESPIALQTARQEQIDYWRKVNKIGKYADK